jgi:hypothetical protein
MIPTSNQMELDFLSGGGIVTSQLLLQDEHKGLSKYLASSPHARLNALESAIEIAEKLVDQYAIQRPEGPRPSEGVQGLLSEWGPC